MRLWGVHQYTGNTAIQSGHLIAIFESERVARDYAAMLTGLNADLGNATFTVDEVRPFDRAAKRQLASWRAMRGAEHLTEGQG